MKMSCLDYVASSCLSYKGISNEDFKNAMAIYNEIEVKKTEKFTYYCGFVWDKGYMGIQELKDTKMLLFSVWDSVDIDKEHNTSDEELSRIEYVAEGVEFSRFCGEGTGWKTYWKSHNVWRQDEPFKMAVTHDFLIGGRIAFTGHYFDVFSQNWKRIATISFPKNKNHLTYPFGRSPYSFIEDFCREPGSARSTSRQAFFGPFLIIPKGSSSFNPQISLPKYFDYSCRPNPAVKNQETSAGSFCYADQLRRRAFIQCGGMDDDFKKYPECDFPGSRAVHWLTTGVAVECLNLNPVADLLREIEFRLPLLNEENHQDDTQPSVKDFNVKGPGYFEDDPSAQFEYFDNEICLCCNASSQFGRLFCCGDVCGSNQCQGSVNVVYKMKDKNGQKRDDYRVFRCQGKCEARSTKCLSHLNQNVS